MWKIITEFIKQRGLQSQTQPPNEEEAAKYEQLMMDNRNFYLKGVTFNIHHSQQISVGISKMQGLTNSIRVNSTNVFSRNKEMDPFNKLPLISKYVIVGWGGEAIIYISGRIHNISNDLKDTKRRKTHPKPKDFFFLVLILTKTLIISIIFKWENSQHFYRELLNRIEPILAQFHKHKVLTIIRFISN